MVTAVMSQYHYGAEEKRMRNDRQKGSKVVKSYMVRQDTGLDGQAKKDKRKETEGRFEK